MDILHTIVLGIVQGLGEFLPISSSAHLILAPWFLGWRDHGLAVDVALHIGTLVSVMVYFRQTWIRLSIAPFVQNERYAHDRRLLLQLIVATVPGVILGLLGKSYAETIFRSPLLIAGTLSSMGVVLWLCDSYWGRKTRSMGDISWRDCIIIGVSQGFAIIPGFSRSGTTISAGLLCGLKRADAARFSFLMSAPIIAGAAVLQTPDIIAHKLYTDPAFWWGIASAALVGFLAIAFLLRYVASRSYLPFAVYRLLLAAVILIVWISRAG